VPYFRTLTEISYELATRLPLLITQQGPILYLAENEKEARLLIDLGRYWNPNFPARAIISPYTQTQQVLTETAFTKLTLYLRRGDKITVSQLAKQLTDLGLEREPRAVSAGTFAVRGNIVDLIDYQPARIEFNNNCVEKITSFNPSTQQIAAPLTHVLVWPPAYAPHLPLWHEQDLTFEFVTPKYYYQRFSLLKQDAEQYLRVQLATAHAEQLRSFIPNAIFTGPQRGLEGFALPSAHFLFLTDDHIFGQDEATEETFQAHLDIASLEPGEYVVHIDHGIALFHKLVTMDGAQYLELHYDKQDKLFVPITKANRVERYVGPPHPRLTRLSGAQWETVVQRVKEDVRQTARELLELQAQREASTTTALPAQITSEENKIAQNIDFELTSDQAQAIQDILTDLASTKPMDRLLCGDVGFGKTEVALQAAVHIILHGGQVAMLAPTTILAQQHYELFTHRLESYGIQVALLSRLTNHQEQRQVFQQLKTGQMDLVVATHRLLAKNLIIPKLKLLIIDEEQRFGVKQKERLKALRHSAHVLSMTATPIPRTLHFALSGLRDISVLNTAPANRHGIVTVIDEYNETLEHRAITEELERNGQVYLVHNNLNTIYARSSTLQRHFPKARIAVIHGKLDATTLLKTMHQFYQGNIDILIASTIIENGLDIPNVNTLIVEHAEQFGLAQLYQLRGRVGRGHRQAYAYFLYYASRLTPQAKQRLKALHTIKELGGGFELAMKDLEIRGVGDMLGTKQHGHLQKIGLNLYTRLLNHAVQQFYLQSGSSETRPQD
jgi:transcription-repair coupling factor (superfamily II helicase)